MQESIETGAETADSLIALYITKLVRTTPVRPETLQTTKKEDQRAQNITQRANVAKSWKTDANANEHKQIWERKRRKDTAGNRSGDKRLAWQQQPNVYLEPKWLR